MTDKIPFQECVTTLTSGFVFALCPPYFVDAIWSQVEPILKRVVTVSNGELTCEGIYRRARLGETRLVIIMKGFEIVAVNVMDIVEFDSGLRAMYIPITGGDYIDEWLLDSLEVAKAIARDYNCTQLRGLATRPGWLKKLPGWEKITDIIKYEVE